MALTAEQEATARAGLAARKASWQSIRRTDRTRDITVRTCKFCGGRAGEPGVTLAHGEYLNCPRRPNDA